jgi:hypothetical protein
LPNQLFSVFDSKAHTAKSPTLSSSGTTPRTNWTLCNVLQSPSLNLEKPSDLSRPVRTATSSGGPFDGFAVNRAPGRIPFPVRSSISKPFCARAFAAARRNRILEVPDGNFAELIKFDTFVHLGVIYIYTPNTFGPQYPFWRWRPASDLWVGVLPSCC